MPSWLANRIDDVVEAAASIPRQVLVPIAIGVALAVSLIEAIVFHQNFFITLFLFGGAWTAILLLARERLRWRQRLFDHVDDLASLERGTWGVFEGIVAQLLRHEGFEEVVERGGFKRGYAPMNVRGEPRIHD